MPSNAPMMSNNPKYRQLHADRAAGILSESEFLLLVGVDVYGVALKEYAVQVGESYDTVRKRLWRLQKKPGANAK